MMISQHAVGLLSLAAMALTGCQEDAARTTPLSHEFISTKTSALSASKRAGAYTVTQLYFTECPYSNLSTFTSTPVTLAPDGSGRPAHDDGIGTVSFPSDFHFYYYGQRKSSFYVSVNGLIQFDTAPVSAADNFDVYSASAGANIVAPWWDDMILARDLESGTLLGSIRTEVSGFTGGRTLTVQWSNLRRRSSSSVMLNQEAIPHDMQVVFYERDSSIEFRYQYMTTTTTTFDSATVGLTEEDPSSPDSVSVRTLDCMANCQEGGTARKWNDNNAQCIKHSPAPARYVTEQSPIEYSASSGGTAVPFDPVALSSGNASANVSFPTGYTFPFFGRTYSSVYVAGNGHISFGKPLVVVPGNDETIPGYSYFQNNRIAGWHGNMVVANASDVTTYISPVDPTVFVIQYVNLASYDSSKPAPGVGTEKHQMQYRLHAATGVIEVQYGALTDPDGLSIDDASVGIEGPSAYGGFGDYEGDFVRALSCTPNCTKANWPTNQKILYIPHTPTWDEIYDKYFDATVISGTGCGTTYATNGHCAMCHASLGSTSASTLSAFLSGVDHPVVTGHECVLRRHSDGRPAPTSVLVAQNRKSWLGWFNTTQAGIASDEPTMPYDTYTNRTEWCGTGTEVITNEANVGPGGTPTRNNTAKRDILSWFSSAIPSTVSLPSVSCAP